MRRIITMAAVVAVMLLVSVTSAQASGSGTQSSGSQSTAPTCPNGATPARNTSYPNWMADLSAQESGLFEGDSGEYALPDGDPAAKRYRVWTDSNGYFFFGKTYTFAATEMHGGFTYQENAPLCGKSVPGVTPPPPPPTCEEAHTCQPPPPPPSCEQSGTGNCGTQQQTCIQTGQCQQQQQGQVQTQVVNNNPVINITVCNESNPCGTPTPPSKPAPKPKPKKKVKSGKCVYRKGQVKLIWSPHTAPATGHITLRLVGTGTKSLTRVTLNVDGIRYGRMKFQRPFRWTIPVNKFSRPGGRLYGNHRVLVRGWFRGTKAGRPALCAKVKKVHKIFNLDPPGDRQPL